MEIDITVPEDCPIVDCKENVDFRHEGCGLARPCILEGNTIAINPERTYYQYTSGESQWEQWEQSAETDLWYSR
jgi:hypothetical protein